MAFTAAIGERQRTGQGRKQTQSSSSRADQLCGEPLCPRAENVRAGALNEPATAGEQALLHSPVGRSGHRPPSASTNSLGSGHRPHSPPRPPPKQGRHLRVRANIFHIGEADGGESVSPAVPGERGRGGSSRLALAFWRMLAKVKDFPQGQVFSKAAGPLPLLQRYFTRSCPPQQPESQCESPAQISSAAGQRHRTKPRSWRQGSCYQQGRRENLLCGEKPFVTAVSHAVL